MKHMLKYHVTRKVIWPCGGLLGPKGPVCGSIFDLAGRVVYDQVEDKGNLVRDLVDEVIVPGMRY